MNYASLLVVVLCYVFGVMSGFSTLLRMTPKIQSTNPEIFIWSIITSLFITTALYYTGHPAFN
jgi:uncharacterized protein YneF (UPF0154 family)